MNTNDWRIDIDAWGLKWRNHILLFQRPSSLFLFSFLLSTNPSMHGEVIVTCLSSTTYDHTISISASGMNEMSCIFGYSQQWKVRNEQQIRDEEGM
jgi:hypothetical protein